ncbi:MAG: hypothetical protein MUC77_11125 [Chromatiaceae bacterium]|nr:hypothetical protein [Chromatiaceae bacterium]
MTRRATCGRCGWLAFSLSALLHAGLVLAFLHGGTQGALGEGSEAPVGVRLDMFRAEAVPGPELVAAA